MDGVSDFDTHPLNAKMDLLKQLLCQYDVLLEMLEGDRREGDKRDGSEGVELTLNDELKCHVPSGVESEEVAPSTQGKKEKKEEEEEGSGSDSTISWCSVSEDPQLPSPVPTPADHPPPNGLCPLSCHACCRSVVVVVIMLLFIHPSPLPSIHLLFHPSISSSIHPSPLPSIYLSPILLSSRSPGLCGA